MFCGVVFKLALWNADAICFAWFGADHHRRELDVTDKVVQRLREGGIVHASIVDFADPAPRTKKVLHGILLCLGTHTADGDERCGLFQSKSVNLLAPQIERLCQQGHGQPWLVDNDNYEEETEGLLNTCEEHEEERVLRASSNMGDRKWLTRDVPYMRWCGGPRPRPGLDL